MAGTWASRARRHTDSPTQYMVYLKSGLSAVLQAGVWTAIRRWPYGSTPFPHRNRMLRRRRGGRSRAACAGPGSLEPCGSPPRTRPAGHTHGVPSGGAAPRWDRHATASNDLARRLAIERDMLRERHQAPQALFEPPALATSRMPPEARRVLGEIACQQKKCRSLCTHWHGLPYHRMARDNDMVRQGLRLR